MSFSHSDEGKGDEECKGSGDGDEGDDQLTTLKKTYELKIKNLNGKIQGYEEELALNEKTLIEQKQKCITLEDQCQTLVKQSKKMKEELQDT